MDTLGGMAKVPSLTVPRPLRAFLVAVGLMAASFQPPLFPSPASASAIQGFTLEAIDPPVQSVPPFETTPIRAVLTNQGALPGGFTVRALRDIPGAWFSSLCSEHQCVIDSLDVYLSPAEQETLWVDVFPFGVPGSGTMEVKVRAHEAPFEVHSYFVGAISGVSQLVVDDDAGANYEDFAVNAFAPSGVTAGVWPASISAPSAADLAVFSSIYWLTGDATSATLTPTDQAELTAFLSAGGRLLVSGQGIGADIGTTTFYRNYLGATFLADHAGSTQVAGTPGDPVGGGLDFAIAGGTGANNQTSPDAIVPRDHVVMRYGTNAGAAARVEGGGIYRTVYLAFGIEGIADDASRAVLLAQARAWLEAAPPIGIAATGSPAAPTALHIAPNPMARGTGPIEISLGLGGARQGRVTVADVHGRIVARFPIHPVGDVLGGRFDGRDALGRPLPPGVYFLSVLPDRGPVSRGRFVVDP